MASNLSGSSEFAFSLHLFFILSCMAATVNERLIASIRQHIPKGTTVAHVLMDLLALGKESAYRRLRGEIPFTVNEMVKISNRFGISIDDVIADSGVVSTKWVTMNMAKFYQPEIYIRQHAENLISFSNAFKVMQSNPNASLRCACNAVPHTFLAEYRNLYQLWHYKWNYLMKGSRPDFVFSDMVIPDELIELEKITMTESRKIPRTTCILGKDIFKDMVDDICFFSSQKLISEDELQKLRSELLDLILETETMTETGCYQSGAEIMIYLSRLVIDSCYFHFEYDEESYCLQRTFHIDKLGFTNNKFCRKQKDWIDLLKRTSLLLTQNCDRQRFDFFKNQRDLVRAMV